MVGILEKSEIINLKRRGKSTREVARITGMDRKTVARYWNEYQQLEKAMQESGADHHEIQEALCAKPKYKAGKRPKKKYTEEIDSLLREIVESEAGKGRVLGALHKQRLTNLQIHDKVLAAGHEISIATVNMALVLRAGKQLSVAVSVHESEKRSVS